MLRTRSLDAGDRVRLERLHARSDWVITLDRHAVLDYLDAPRRDTDVYERFVIDAVPDRARPHHDAAGHLHLEPGRRPRPRGSRRWPAMRPERQRAEQPLSRRAPEGAERPARDQAGRWGIRAPASSSRSRLMHANCIAASQGHGRNLAGTETGPCSSPVDEIASHAPIVTMAGADGEPALRADFIHVSAPARGPLEFRFVEVKHRQHLRTARQPDLLAHMVAQAGELRRRWHDVVLSESSLAPLERVVRPLAARQTAPLLRRPSGTGTASLSRGTPAHVEPRSTSCC